MIEACIRFQRFPAGRDVTIAAPALKRSIFERTFMGIRVAVIAARIAQLAEARHGFAANTLVAPGTIRTHMLSGQRIGGFVVIEQFRRLPLGLGVASGAFGAKLAFVRVLMTLGAFTPHSEKRLVFVFQPDLSRVHFHTRRRVAPIAFQRCVLAL